MFITHSVIPIFRVYAGTRLFAVYLGVCLVCVWGGGCLGVGVVCGGVFYGHLRCQNTCECKDFLTAISFECFLVELCVHSTLSVRTVTFMIHLLPSSQLLAGVGHSLAGYHLLATGPAHEVCTTAQLPRGGGRGREAWLQHSK